MSVFPPPPRDERPRRLRHRDRGADPLAWEAPALPPDPELRGLPPAGRQPVRAYSPQDKLARYDVRHHLAAAPSVWTAMQARTDGRMRRSCSCAPAPPPLAPARR
ncbi:unnamed protein product [Chrysodeixis includens]|uniref:Uncharacterized protein n=1 Tax=Chrysodeixis includens TaxID=689277 RepID=A0A9N8KQL3_CHRIL|nr:unnamed protein product [Chrysodeixis includens]